MLRCKAQLSEVFFKAVVNQPDSEPTKATVKQHKTAGSDWDMTHIPDSGKPFILEISSISEGVMSG